MPCFKLINSKIFDTSINQIDQTKNTFNNLITLLNEYGSAELNFEINHKIGLKSIQIDVCFYLLSICIFFY